MGLYFECPGAIPLPPVAIEKLRNDRGKDELIDAAKTAYKKYLSARRFDATVTRISTGAI